MEQNIIQTDIHRAVEAIKVAILQTRHKVMIQANKDSLALNYSIGGYISCRKQTSHWGDKVLDAISSQLQQELPGLRGFTKSNLKKMCVFYEGWKEFFGLIFLTRSAVVIIWARLYRLFLISPMRLSSVFMMWLPAMVQM